jgi:riboflavin kinase / FMN adenylyltransferase
MQVHHRLDALPTFTNAVLTIGTFDGLHAGHRKIIDQLIQQAQKVGGHSVIVTFHPHPRKVVGQSGKEIRLLHTLPEKIELLANAGVDHLVVVPFTPQFAALPATAYVSDFLVKYFAPHTLIIGYDHRFGHQRQGNFALLQALGEQYHFRVQEIAEQLIKNNTVSSTVIRDALAAGNVAAANAALGYVYFFDGEVVQGRQLGRTIGFATANLQPTDPEKLIPGHGVYAIAAQLQAPGGQAVNPMFFGMMNIGVRPTLNGTHTVVEAHLFNFDGDIYGRTLRVWIRQHLRGEIKFEGIEALKAQLAKDKSAALSLYAGVAEVFVEGAQLVDDASRCKFDNAVGYGLHKRVVVAGKQHNTLIFNTLFVESLNAFQIEVVGRLV